MPAIALLLGLALLAQQPLPRAPFVATPPDVVDRMLALAKVGPRDVVYDLGCGDGRIVIAAAQKYGARGVGIDIDPARIAEAEENARRAGVQRLVTFKLKDAPFGVAGMAEWGVVRVRANPMAMAMIAPYRLHPVLVA